MIDTYEFICNVGQQFFRKGADHATNPTIDNK